MLVGYTSTGKDFSEYDLSSLGPKQALVVQTASGKKLEVRLTKTSRAVYVNNRACMSEAIVGELLSIDIMDRPVRNAERVVKVGDFWQFDQDLMSHRVNRIELHECSESFGNLFGEGFGSLFEPR